MLRQVSLTWVGAQIPGRCQASVRSRPVLCNLTVLANSVCVLSMFYICSMYDSRLVYFDASLVVV
jgi:hypothetical protein